MTALIEAMWYQLAPKGKARIVYFLLWPLLWPLSQLFGMISRRKRLSMLTVKK